MLEEFDGSFSRDMSAIHRCSICDKVNNPSIENKLGDFQKSSFTADPKNKMFSICIECYEIINDTITDYGFYDEDIVT